MSIVACTYAAPQGLRTEFAPPGQEEDEQIDPSDIINLIVRTVSAFQNNSNLRGGGGRRQGGGEGNLMRILISLVAREFGLINSDGRSDGIDQELIVRNLIRTFTNIVGNVLLS